MLGGDPFLIGSDLDTRKCGQFIGGWRANGKIRKSVADLKRKDVFLERHVGKEVSIREGWGLCHE